MSNTEENKSKKLIENGYSIGTIVTKSSGECMVLIEEASSKKLYDPINIEEEQFKVFMSDALPIYFKFLPLKRMNRCNAQPIKILDIKKREGQ